ncbi:MAG: hypothetical protein M3Q22_00735 [Actinomycetota bacterium]|nr:hypothetical protein [Actinomycetota bacterium]
MTNSRAGKAKERPVRTSERRLHVVDIENLAGTGPPDSGAVTHLRATYMDVVGVSSVDHVVVACNPGCLVDVGAGWRLRCARYRVGSGCNGADLALLDVLECESVAERFTEVVIASGDGIFASSAARLSSVGCDVTVVSRRRSLSTKLALAAQRVVYLPEAEVAAAPAVLPLRRAA